MARKSKSETLSFLRLVSVTLLVLGVLTALNTVIILNNLGTEILTPLKRNIASVAEKKKNEDLFAPAITLRWNCKKQNKLEPHITNADQVRLEFYECEKPERPINQANNSQADLFPINKNSWTSDFLPLSPGKNKIAFKVGKKSQVIEITRDTPSPQVADKAL